MTRLAGALLAALLSACGEPAPAPCSDGGAEHLDSGSEPIDAGPLDADGGSEGPADAGEPYEPDAGAPVSPLSPLCDGAATAPFEPPTSCDALSGNTTTTRPANSIYSTSWFGCYRDDSGRLVTDPYDNCQFACGSRGVCSGALTGPECQAELAWFAAGADRFGCGQRIRVTNCANGRAVVLAVLDRGPNCRTVEKAYGAPVMDMSHPAMTHLFEGRTYGGRDFQRVVVETAASDAPLGPVQR